MKDLGWDKVAPVFFYSALTLITGYIGYTLRDLNANIFQLNIQMGSVIEKLATTSRDSEVLRVRQEDHTRSIYDLNGRVLVLEKTK